MAKKKNSNKKENKFNIVLHGKVDIPLIIITIILVTVGLIVLSSASYPTSYSEHGNSYHYLIQQLKYAVIGIVLAIIISFFDYNKLKNKAIISISFLAVVALMWYVGILGDDAGGAKRWMSFGPYTIQPSEFAKYVYVVCLAFYLSYTKQKRNIKGGFVGFLLPVCMFAMLAVPIFWKQNHMSTTIILAVITIVQMFVIGSAFVSDIKFIIPILILGIVVLTGIIYFNSEEALNNSDNTSKNFRIVRIQTWLNPDENMNKESWQINQSLYAVGSGGIFGAGLGESTQKYLYLPEAQNDFIFAVLAEELGFIGSVSVIMLFIAFIWRGMTIAFKAQDDFSKLIAIGVTSIIGFQALINVAVVTNTIPVTGMPLPFFSAGGSALIANLCGIGLLIAVSKNGDDKSKLKQNK